MKSSYFKKRKLCTCYYLCGWSFPDSVGASSVICLQN